ncbi:MAG TPA: MYXO-CTERM sorting domain-containing protein, partial [Polyangium sp.]|nr:MYXO-CTERM sorting domain-containing protein [Polyangium sp.]
GGGAGGGGGNGETPGDSGSCGCRLGAESAGATLWGASAFVIGLLLRRRKAKGIIGAPPRR